MLVGPTRQNAVAIENLRFSLPPDKMALRPWTFVRIFQKLKERTGNVYENKGPRMSS